MDPVALGFYAVVCGLLAAAGPSLGGVFARLLAGAAVGLIAAGLLPYLRAAFTG